LDKHYSKELDYIMKAWNRIEKLLDAKNLGREIGYAMLSNYQREKNLQTIKFILHQSKVTVLLNGEEIATVETKDPKTVSAAIKEGILSIWLAPKPL